MESKRTMEWGMATKNGYFLEGEEGGTVSTHYEIGMRGTFPVLSGQSGPGQDALIHGALLDA